MKRMTAILLAILLLASCPLALAAAATRREPGIELYYAHTSRINAQISIDSGGKASCSGALRGSSSDTKSSLTLTLYQYNAGWKSVCSWSASANGRVKAVASGAKKVAKGYQYKVVASGQIKDANGKVLERPSKTQTATF